MKMWHKLLMITGICVAVFSCAARAQQRVEVPCPSDAELIETRNVGEALVYMFRTTGTSQTTEEFYTEHFLSNGWQLSHPLRAEEAHTAPSFVPDKNLKTVVFTRKNGFHVAALSLDSSKSGRGTYNIFVYTPKRFAPFRSFRFRAPTQLEFMPTLSGAREFIYFTDFPPMIGVGYLTRQSVDPIERFYKRTMPRHGWLLQDEQERSGMMPFDELLMTVDPYTKVLTYMKQTGFTDLIPPLQMNGKTLSYRKGSDKLTITIYSFPHVYQRSLESPFDMEEMNTYGSTLVAVYYFDH
ncbi:MAG: hypothetical protein GF333_08030 [Candidatus Omnitrophica bacterium]|nr:hypothetical protein [Candidatus Omnitrophota bacterium]